jgi:hypothetical protein
MHISGWQRKHPATNKYQFQMQMQIQIVPIWKIQQNFLRTKLEARLTKKKNQRSKTDFCNMRK